MNREDIDIMWNKALQQAIKDGEEFTRYHFAALVAAAAKAEENEACAKACEEIEDKNGWSPSCTTAIRARKKNT